MTSRVVTDLIRHLKHFSFVSLGQASSCEVGEDVVIRKDISLEWLAKNCVVTLNSYQQFKGAKFETLRSSKPNPKQRTRK